MVLSSAWSKPERAQIANRLRIVVFIKNIQVSIMESNVLHILKY
jgi:hypothetical protein